MTRRTPARESRIPPALDSLPEVLVPREIAALLRVTAPTVRKLIASGVLPAMRLGPDLRAPMLIKKRDYLRWYNREK